MQSALETTRTLPAHLAIIMDGNGRWAIRRGLPREAGHQEGVRAVCRVVEAARELGIQALTLFAFSGDNWRRPAREVANLLSIFETFFGAEKPRWIERGIQVSIIGRRDRFPTLLLEAIEAAERATTGGGGMRLRFALDYSGRDAILRAAARLPQAPPATQENFARLLEQVTNSGASTPEVDLIIRTGGEQRLSDFLLWESAYAELYFTDRMWPDFTAADLEDALREYACRDRRFGRIGEPVAS